MVKLTSLVIFLNFNFILMKTNEVLNNFQPDLLFDSECNELSFVGVNVLTSYSKTDHNDSSSWSAALNCSFNYHHSASPPFDISWHFNGKRLASNNWLDELSGLTVESLTITNFSMADYGRYICVMVGCKQFEFYSAETSFQPVLKLNASSAFVGDAIEAHCVSIPNSKIQWSFSPVIAQLLSATTADQQGNTVSQVTFAIGYDTFAASSVKISCCAIATNESSCSAQNITINDLKPQLVDYQSYSKNDFFDGLSCLFASHQLPLRVRWTSCLSNDNCSLLQSETFDSFYAVSNYSVTSTEKSIYKCEAIDILNHNISHQFNINGQQVVPQVITYNVTVDGDDIVYECQIRAQPTPQITWIKKGLTTESTLEETAFNIISYGYDFYVTTLKINYIAVNQDDILYSNYRCLAKNEHGIAISSDITGDIFNDSFRLGSSKEDNIFEIGDEVVVTCSHDFLLGSVNFVVISQFDIHYSVNEGDRHSNVTFTADEVNNHVIVQCEAVNYLSKAIAKKKISIVTNYESSANGDKKCYGDECELICSSKRWPGSTLTRYQWLYFSHFDNNSFYLLTENTSVVPVSESLTNFTISLSSYYAGHYQCLINYYNPVNIYDSSTCVFKIDWSEEGRNLNEQCDNTTQCLAYNSRCQTSNESDDDEFKVCQCVYPFDIQLRSYDNTSACLQAVPPGEYCYNTEQCSSAETNFNCTEFHCQCDEFLVQIQQLNASFHCIYAVEYGDECVFNEECQMYDKNSFCHRNVCDCIDGYIYKDFQDTCGEDRRMSGGKIAGAVLTSVSVVVLLVFFITFGKGKYKLLRRNSSVSDTRQLTFDSTESDDTFAETPQFNSLTQFPPIPDDD
ncbi:hypothetical protein CHUAL_011564 [Chamberlinius hualienensis]